jgi:hypothetical protein
MLMPQTQQDEEKNLGWQAYLDTRRILEEEKRQT